MNYNKYMRKKHRKEMHEAEKQQLKEQREKTKSNKDNNPNGKPYQKVRKLKDGGIAFGKNYKIGRGGLIGISVVTGILLFLIAGLGGMYDEYLAQSPNVDEFYLPPQIYTPIINGEEAKDYSGNVIKFNSQEMADEYVRRVTGNGMSSNDFGLNSIGNFFLHPYLMLMP